VTGLGTCVDRSGEGSGSRRRERGRQVGSGRNTTHSFEEENEIPMKQQPSRKNNVRSYYQAKIERSNIRRCAGSADYSSVQNATSFELLRSNPKNTNQFSLWITTHQHSIPSNGESTCVKYSMCLKWFVQLSFKRSILMEKQFRKS
jgi:hypothetical protein